MQNINVRKEKYFNGIEKTKDIVFCCTLYSK